MYDDYIPDDDRMCGTCRHWDITKATQMGIPLGTDLAPCKEKAVEVDAGPGKAMVLLAHDNHCQCQNAKWEPSSDYLDDMKHGAHINDGIYAPFSLYPSYVTHSL